MPNQNSQLEYNSIQHYTSLDAFQLILPTPSFIKPYCLTLIFIKKHNLFKTCKSYIQCKSNLQEQDNKIHDKLLSSTRRSPFSELQLKIVGWVDGAGAQVYSGASTSTYGCCWKKKKSHALQNHPLKITGLMVKIRLETEHSNLCYFAV